MSVPAALQTSPGSARAASQEAREHPEKARPALSPGGTAGSAGVRSRPCPSPAGKAADSCSRTAPDAPSDPAPTRLPPPSPARAQSCGPRTRKGPGAGISGAQENPTIFYKIETRPGARRGAGVQPEPGSRSGSPHRRPAPEPHDLGGVCPANSAWPLKGDEKRPSPAPLRPQDPAGSLSAHKAPRASPPPGESAEPPRDAARPSQALASRLPRPRTSPEPAAVGAPQSPTHTLSSAAAPRYLTCTALPPLSLHCAIRRNTDPVRPP